jgi:hypothetical protein
MVVLIKQIRKTKFATVRKVVIFNVLPKFMDLFPVPDLCYAVLGPGAEFFAFVVPACKYLSAGSKENGVKRRFAQRGSWTASYLLIRGYDVFRKRMIFF